MSLRILLQTAVLIPILCGPLCAEDGATPARLDLAWIVGRVRLRNPEFLAAQAQVEAAKAMATASRSWPDPEIGVEFWGVPRPGLDLASAGQKWLDFSQEIPFPTKTILQSEIAGHAFRLQEVRAEKTLQDQIFEAKQAYWDLFTAAESLKVVSKTERALDQLADQSGHRVRLGEGGRTDQLMDPMARIERTGLGNQALALEQERVDARARLAQLTATELPDSVLDPLDGASGDVSDAEAAALQEHALAGSPGVLEAERDLLQTQARRRLAESAWAPDLMLQYSLVDNTGGPQGSMAMAKVNLPFIWFWRQGAEVKAADREVDASAAMLKSAEEGTSSMVTSEAAMLRTARAQLKNDRSEALPDADSALDLGLSGYQTGSVGVSDALGAVKAYLMVQLEAIGLTAQIGRSVAGLEALADAGLDGHSAMEMNHEIQ